MKGSSTDAYYRQVACKLNPRKWIFKNFPHNLLLPLKVSRLQLYSHQRVLYLRGYMKDLWSTCIDICTEINSTTMMFLFHRKLCYPNPKNTISTTCGSINIHNCQMVLLSGMVQRGLLHHFSWASFGLPCLEILRKMRASIRKNKSY
jgi:hypothetical protein